ncbi:MAG: ThiF family adenylyltransferase [Ignavibacteria bacterium]|nr:ThiF family adenylyltransferase [Ignavibacteria bacterium]
MSINIDDGRYSRLELITWWDQDILKNARVLVAGCGALGNEIIKNLAMLGIGHIFVADMDRVEKSNLTRSILFRKEDEGRSKAVVAKEGARHINDEIDVRAFDGNIFNLGLGVFKDFDIIIGGLDNREARLFINQSCWKVNRPWVDGAIEVLNGVARMFVPPQGACYECTMSELDYKLINKRKSCMLLGIDEILEGKIPTTPTIASVIAGIQVQEAVKYLHRREDLVLLNGKGLVFNGGVNDSYIVEYQRNEDCPSHYTFERIEHLNKNFNEVRVSDIIEFGINIFGSEDFQIDFNNEVVYELVNEEKREVTEHYGNMNTMSVKDVKTSDGNFLKIKSFNSLGADTGLAKRLELKTLSELKLPHNDILTLRKGEEELHLEFDNAEVFIK